MTLRPPALSLTLPGVVAWARPRAGRGQVRYPLAYVEGRMQWAFEVKCAVLQTGWDCPPVRAPLAVEAEVVTGGKHDLDRIGTALLDALQGGGAIVDDCRVFDVHLTRRRPGKGEAPHVTVLLGLLGDAPG